MQTLSGLRVEDDVNHLNEQWKMEALPENVTAGLHFQSLPECIKGKMQRNSQS